MQRRDVVASGSNDPNPSPAPTCDFALVVGVDDYPNFRDLRGAIADATAFHEWVCSAENWIAPTVAELRATTDLEPAAIARLLAIPPSCVR